RSMVALTMDVFPCKCEAKRQRTPRCYPSHDPGEQGSKKYRLDCVAPDAPPTSILYGVTAFVGPTRRKETRRTLDCRECPVECPSCGNANRDGAIFCSRCGAALTRA